MVNLGKDRVMIIKCKWCNDIVNAICMTETVNGYRWLCDRHMTETNRDMYWDRVSRLCERNPGMISILADYRKASA